MRVLAKGQWSADLKKETSDLKAYFEKLEMDWNRKTPPYCYHYSSLDTVMKILESRQLRLYDILSMNDKEEFLHPLRIVNESMQPYRGKLPNQIANFFQERERIEFGDRWYGFASCFCAAEESQHMWTEFGRNGLGAAIRFDLPVLGAEPTNIALYPMMYDDGWFRETLRDSYQYVVSRDWLNRFRLNEANAAAYEFCRQILTLILCVKRECFVKESEWRALRLMPAGPSYNIDDKGRRYLEIDLPPPSVSAIVMGPNSSKKEADLKGFVNTTIYSNAKIIGSALS